MIRSTAFVLFYFSLASTPIDLWQSQIESIGRTRRNKWFQYFSIFSPFLLHPSVSSSFPDWLKKWSSQQYGRRNDSELKWDFRSFIPNGATDKWHNHNQCLWRIPGDFRLKIEHGQFTGVSGGHRPIIWDNLWNTKAAVKNIITLDFIEHICYGNIQPHLAASNIDATSGENPLGFIPKGDFLRLPFEMKQWWNRFNTSLKRAVLGVSLFVIIISENCVLVTFQANKEINCSNSKMP